MKRAWLKWLLALAVCGAGLNGAAEGQGLTYLVLADTVEPLMLASEEEPMRGGIVTDTLMEIFVNTDHQISPLVIPWQRVAVEMRERDDWIMYGLPSQCSANEGCAVSAEPIVEFNHVLVTLSGSSLKVDKYQDLFGQQLLLVENFHYPGLDNYLVTSVDQQGTGQIHDIRAFSPAGALRMLRHRRGEAYIDWRLRVLYNLNKANLQLKDVRISNASALIPDQNIHFFYSDKLSKNLRDLIDDRLKTLRQDGAMTRILKRYQPAL
jgi:hypothetical protein